MDHHQFDTKFIERNRRTVSNVDCDELKLEMLASSDEIWYIGINLYRRTVGNLALNTKLCNLAEGWLFRGPFKFIDVPLSLSNLSSRLEILF